MQPPRRDRGLSRAEIVRAAIAVADAEGPEAISMRRIAREVRAGVMSLYWYVSSKEELLDLMLDAIEAEIEVPDPSGDWRADLGVFAHRTRDSLRRLFRQALADDLDAGRLTFLDLDWGLVGRELMRIGSKRRTGPHAENMLRDLGVVAAGSH